MKDVKGSHKHICNDQALSGKERGSPRCLPGRPAWSWAGMFEGSRASRLALLD